MAVVWRLFEKLMTHEARPCREIVQCRCVVGENFQRFAGREFIELWLGPKGTFVYVVNSDQARTMRVSVERAP